VNSFKTSKREVLHCAQPLLTNQRLLAMYIWVIGQIFFDHEQA